MRSLVLFAAFAAPLCAQLPAPNEAGVSMGHVHLIVKDPEAQQKLWTDVIGAQASQAGALTLLKLPGIFIVVTKGDPMGGSNGSVLNHVGFLVKSYADIKAKLTAANIKLLVDSAQNKQIIAEFPEQVRVEFNEDSSIGAPLTMHHMHLFVSDPEAERAWYVKTFGAVPGKRAQFEAADLPGINLTFSGSPTPTVPTQGRALNSICFEVKGLLEFVAKLNAEGVRIEKPYAKLPNSSIAKATITDPWGTTIELTEGLASTP